MKSKFIFLIFSLGILFLSSCASSSQLVAVQTKVDDLSKKVDEFNVKYSEILSENKLLKGKLEGMVPLASSEVSQFLFEIVGVKRSGSSVILEVVITNKRDKLSTLRIDEENITVTDEFGNKAFDILLNGKANFIDVDCYPSAPVKFIVTANDYKSSSKMVGVLGINHVKIDLRDQLEVFLKNVSVE